MVPELRCALGGRVASALLGMDVQHHGAIRSAQGFERIHECLYVVSRFNVGIAEAQGSEDIRFRGAVRGA